MQSDTGTDWKDHLLADEPRLRDVNGIAAISEFVPEPESAYWDIDYEFRSWRTRTARSPPNTPSTWTPSLGPTT